MISVRDAAEMMYVGNPGGSMKSNPAWDDSRPDWDAWFMTLCFVVAQRSLDKHTKCGCVVVDSSRSILSVGYNSPPRGCPDDLVPLDRPLKYEFMAHAEANAIANAARVGTSLKGSIFYITGPPCSRCFADIKNVGAVKLFQGPVIHRRTQEEICAVEIMNSNKSIEILDFDKAGSLDKVFELLVNTAKYIGTKLETHEEKNT